MAKAVTPYITHDPEEHDAVTRIKTLLDEIKATEPMRQMIRNIARGCGAHYALQTVAAWRASYEMPR